MLKKIKSVFKKSPPIKSRGRPPLKKRYFNSQSITLPISDITRDDIAYFGGGIARGFNSATLAHLRRLAITTPYIRSYLLLLKNGVVGSQPIRPTFANLTNRAKGKQLKKLWQKFEMDVCTNGETTMQEFQRAMLEQFVVDGRVLAVIRMDAEYNQGIALQSMPRDTLLVNTDAGGNIINGLEYSPTTGRKKTYHFQSRLNVDSSIVLEKKQISIAAGLVLDLKTKNRMDNWDNHASVLYAAINTVDQISKLDNAILKSSQAGACKMGFLQSDIGAVEPEEYESAEEYEEDLPDKLSVGTIEKLPQGMSFTSFDPSSPNIPVLEFRKAMLRACIGSMGGDYNSVVVDSESVNYNSLRHMTLQVRDNFRAFQSQIIDTIMRPFVRHWLRNAQLQGLIQLSTKDIQVAMDTPFETRTYPWVDPVKDTKSKIDQLRMGAMSVKDLAQETGKSVENVLLENREVFDMMKEIGFEENQIILALFGGGEMPQAAPAMPADDDAGAGMPENEN